MTVRFLIPTILLGLAPSAWAQTSRSPDAGACGAERRELEAKEQRLRACFAERSDLTERAQRCATDLEGARDKGAAAAREAEACSTAKDALCGSVASFAQTLVDGRPPPAAQVCVPDKTRDALADVVAGWSRARESLGQLAAWSRGESDLWPQGHPEGGTPADAVARRIVGVGRLDAPAYRRLLVEAVRLVAPRFLRKLRSGGPVALDAWFSSGAELETTFTAEAQSALGARGAGAGPRQSAALRFVQAHQELMGCGQRAVRECARARRLQAFLESSVPLIVRQRVQEIWFTSCAELGPPSTLTWLRELPASQPSLGEAEWDEIIGATYAKLVSCYLGAPDDEDDRFPEWLGKRLPDAGELTTRTLAHVDDLRRRFVATGAEAVCLDALHALRTLPAPTTCSLPDDAVGRLKAWFQRATTAEAGADGASARACATYVRALWLEQRPHVLPSYPGAPAPEALVRIDRSGALQPVAALRALCDARVGSVNEFPRTLRRTAVVARFAGEELSDTPWRLDAASELPIEEARFAAAMRPFSWLVHDLRHESPCEALGLPAARCKTCTPALASTTYDCGLVAAVAKRWDVARQTSVTLAVALVVLGGLLRWGWLYRRGARRFGGWRREIGGQVASLGLVLGSDARSRFLPSQLGILRARLPADGAWERWGKVVVLVRAEQGGAVTARDVTRAALAARAEDGELALLCHDEGASPDLAAVRAMLDWAARGPRRAVQVLPVSNERLRWARTTEDLLDLVEQTSLRGNPFEVRGRLVSSSQFFNRESLVSGLLAACQAGHWTIVTGLRRFGKSSLALEVARRLQGAHAYVDLAGFHHEVSSSGDPGRVADEILRYVCEQLHASAMHVHRSPPGLPDVPAEGTSLDPGTLVAWMRALVGACRKQNGDRPVNLLVILDEVEQAIGVGPARIQHAVEVVSIFVGRLRAALGDTLLGKGGDRIGVLFCSALHPLLWAPLATLSSQSLLGAFPSVFVPRLPDDAAYAMMRGLGGRQGIRFTDAALALIVREAQGIPILVRRIGSAVLELYDPERARQGSLGAVEIGVEGATAAVRREEEDGAPLRVWVESEIGDPHNPAGVVLRALARAGRMSVPALKKKAAEVTAEQFAVTGIARLLSEEEIARRSEEAAGYVVRMLGDIGLLEPQGDLTRPDGYTFPDSIVRRILATNRRDSLLGL